MAQIYYIDQEKYLFLDSNLKRNLGNNGQKEKKIKIFKAPPPITPIFLYKR